MIPFKEKPVALTSSNVRDLVLMTLHVQRGKDRLRAPKKYWEAILRDSQDAIVGREMTRTEIVDVIARIISPYEINLARARLRAKHRAIQRRKGHA